MPAIACAFSRRSASPVRITTPVSMSSGVSAGVAIGLVDDGAQLGVVDALLALVGRERDRRAVERLAVDHEIAAGQVLAHAAQLDLGEDHLRARRADVDADAGQRDVVLQPERIVLERPVVEIVVVVVGVAVMDVAEIGAEPMVGERVRVLVRILARIFGIGHAAVAIQQNGLPREPVCSTTAERRYHFWEPYQSSMSLRT